VERAVEISPLGFFTVTCFNKASEDTGSHWFYFAAICCYSHRSKLFALSYTRCCLLSISPSLLLSFFCLHLLHEGKCQNVGRPGVTPDMTPETRSGELSLDELAREPSVYRGSSIRPSVSVSNSSLHLNRYYSDTRKARTRRQPTQAIHLHSCELSTRTEQEQSPWRYPIIPPSAVEPRTRCSPCTCGDNRCRRRRPGSGRHRRRIRQLLPVLDKTRLTRRSRHAVCALLQEMAHTSRAQGNTWRWELGSHGVGAGGRGGLHRVLCSEARWRGVLSVVSERGSAVAGECGGGFL